MIAGAILKTLREIRVAVIFRGCAVLAEKGRTEVPLSEEGGGVSHVSQPIRDRLLT